VAPRRGAITFSNKSVVNGFELMLHDTGLQRPIEFKFGQICITQSASLSGLNLAFLFSTVIITIFGEIIPQAYFSRNAIRVGALLSPVLRFYQIILFPVAKLTAIILDTWLGKEAIHFYRERDLREIIKMHVESPKTEMHSIYKSEISKTIIVYSET